MNWTIHSFSVLKSTNTTALSYPVGSVIIANEQTNGKGRNGRVWQSLSGNLFLSAVLPAFDTQTPLLSFVAAVSLAEALNDYPVRIKWPNDILLNGAKIAGILLERHEEKVIAGFGVNTSSAPTQALLYKTASLNNTISNNALTQKLLNALSENLEVFKTQGFNPIYQKWLEKAAGIGTQITVRLPNESLSGIFESLTPQGAISLKINNNERRLITAGDVFFNNMQGEK